MGFPESILTSEEQVVLHLHPHWRKLVAPVFWVVLVVAAAVAAGVLWGGTGVLVVAVLGVGLLSWLALWPWLRWRGTHYVFTSERVLLREGVLARRGRDIPLGRINDVSFSHSLLERMLGCGTMTIESAGERGQVTLVDLPRVEHTQSVLYELVEADRQRYLAGVDQVGEPVRPAGSGRPPLSAPPPAEPVKPVVRVRDLREGNPG